MANCCTCSRFFRREKRILDSMQFGYELEEKDKIEYWQSKIDFAKKSQEEEKDKATHWKLEAEECQKNLEAEEKRIKLNEIYREKNPLQLKVTEACEPDQIMWNNLGIDENKRKLGQTCASIITVLAFLIAGALLMMLKVGERIFAENVQ